MKNFAILCLALLSLHQASAREFKSADGEKTVIAEFVRYNPRTSEVTLRMANGRNMVTDSALFSDEDQAFFKEQFRNSQLDGAVSVRSHDKLNRDAYKEGKLLITFTDANYVFTIKNESEVDFDNLQVKYWVLVERYNKGETFNETFDGNATVQKLAKESDEEVAGPKIRLITGAVVNHTTDNDNEANRLLNEAAKYGRDRAIGWRVEVHTADGKELYADSSSIRVDRALGLDKKD